jgi:hypothetical protein
MSPSGYPIGPHAQFFCSYSALKPSVRTVDAAVVGDHQVIPFSNH